MAKNKITEKQFKELVELEIARRKEHNHELSKRHREYIASLIKNDTSILLFDGDRLSAYHSVNKGEMLIDGVIITCDKFIREIEKSRKYRNSKLMSLDKSNVACSLRFKLGMPNSNVIANDAVKQKMQELLDVIYDRKPTTEVSGE